MTRRELYDLFNAQTRRLYPDREAGAIARIILEDLYGVQMRACLSDPAAEVSLASRPDPEKICARIRAGEPVQYVTGSAEFCGLRFAVGKGVLIPRRETEELVAWIVSEVGGDGPARVLDLGCGSGAIGVSIAKLVSHAAVTAVDISPVALRVTAANAAANGARVRTVKGDMLSDPSAADGMPEAASMDAVVSNPPYIPISERAAMDRNVTDWEPGCALFVSDDDPIEFYRGAAAWAAYFLRRGGKLWFEVHEKHAGAVAEYLMGAGWKGIALREDMAGRPRMIMCSKP